MRRPLALMVAVALLLGGDMAGPQRPAVATASAPSAVPPTAAQSGAHGAVRPVDGPVVRRFDPPATPYGAGHRGVDLAAPPGTPVRAAMSGTVAFAGLVAGRGWVTVDHGGGLDTTYGWLDPREVGRGDRIRVGQVLGLTAPDSSHLDWGARLHATYIDPLGLLGPWRARLVPTTGVGSAGEGVS